MCKLGVFPIFLENDLLKVDKILGLIFFKARKDLKDSKQRFSIYCSWVLFSIDCLQLPFIRVEVSWTRRFLTRKIGPRKLYVSSKQEKEWYRKRMSYLEQTNHHFCQHFMRRKTQQTLLAINLASQQKTTKLYFSSQVRKQFNLLTVPFKPLHSCYEVLNLWITIFRVIWSVNQIVLSNGFLSDFVEITSCVLKQLFFSISVNSAFRNSYLDASRLGPEIFSHYSPRFQRIIVKWPGNFITKLVHKTFEVNYAFKIHFKSGLWFSGQCPET